MAFFGLTDIKFNQIDPRAFGPLAALEGSPFEKTTLKYPLDIGSPDKGHYMVFFVREQKNTSYGSETRGGRTFAKEEEKAIYDALNRSTQFLGGGVGAGKQTFADTINEKLTNLVSKGTSSVIQKFGSGSTAGKVSGVIDSFIKGPQASSQLRDERGTIETSIKAITDKNASTAAGAEFLVRTRLTNEAIALYMPDTLNFDSTANYTDIKPGEELLGQAMVAAPNLVAAVKAGDTKGILNAAAKSGLGSMIAQQLAQKAGVGAGVSRLGAYFATGGVTNPMIELMYTAPDFRSFQFEFMFYPRSEREALEVQRIIDRFRFHQAPELMGGLTAQTGLLIPPSEFDIKFFYAGRQNPNLPPIATCVLKSVQVNFAPRGFSAYETVGENSAALGRTGMPVAIQMTLSFQETTYITKEDFSPQQLGNPYKTDSIRSQAMYAAGGTGGFGFGQNKIS
jgi:hypothetical protein